MKMNKSKEAKLKAAGWTLGQPEAFLGLTREETAMVEVKLALAQSLRRRRIRRKLSQEALAELVGSSQSRVAKMEAADASVTIDLLMRALFTMGVSRREVAKLLATKAA